jgi:hypothetical protein
MLDAQVGYIRDGLPDYVIVVWFDDTVSYDFSKINSAYVMVDWKDPEVGSSYYVTLYVKQAAE